MQCIAHDLEATFLFENIVITEQRLLLVAEQITDRIEGLAEARVIALGVLDDLAVLDVEPSDLIQIATAGAIGRDELGDNREGFGGVDGHAWSIVKMIIQAIRVEVASSFITDTIVTTRSSTAAGLTLDGADVRSVCSAEGIGFPDVHLDAAGTIHASSRARLPVEKIRLSIDEFNILRTLGVAITGSKLGACLIVGILRRTSVGRHFDEIKRAIQSTRQAGEIDVECELLILQMEHLIGRIVLQEIVP